MATAVFGLARDGRRVPHKEALQVHGVRILLPTQPLDRRPDPEVSHLRPLDCLAQHWLETCGVQVGLDKAGQVRGSRLDAIGLRVERTGIHPCLGAMAVSPRVPVHRLLGNIDKRTLHAK
jgi:hypothetical protein